MPEAVLEHSSRADLGHGALKRLCDQPRAGNFDIRCLTQYSPAASLPRGNSQISKWPLSILPMNSGPKGVSSPHFTTNQLSV
jgi:hypothetical protein